VTKWKGDGSECYVREVPVVTHDLIRMIKNT
jgi:hypothetical protein